MLKIRFLFRTAVFLSFAALSGFTQIASEWKVKPQWVRAQEMFLASDALRGRGSATPDELITATYVASQFARFGLKPGLPDGTYLQRVELVQPVVEGKTKIVAPESAGFAALEEGKDFSLLLVGSGDSSGPLPKVTAADLSNLQIKSGSVVLLSADASAQGNAFFRKIFAGGAKTVLRVDSSLTPEQLQKNLEQRPTGRPHVARISSAIGGNFNIVAVSKEAADRLWQLQDGTSIALQLQTKDTSRYSYNAVGVLPGKDSGAAAKVILLSAHLDHLGIGRPVNGDSIYNGANDDASGTTAVIELAHALAAGRPLRRTVYFVCYGSEELGGLGSTYFREHPPAPLDSIAANLEFEMIGNPDPKMPKGKLLLTGWDRSNLGPTLVEHGALLGDDPYPEQRFFQRSDNYPLALKGIVAHTAAGWGTVPTYHQPDDDLEHMDLNFMTEAIQSLIDPIRWLANSNFVPQWNPGKQPEERH